LGHFLVERKIVKACTVFLLVFLLPSDGPYQSINQVHYSQARGPRGGQTSEEAEPIAAQQYSRGRGGEPPPEGEAEKRQRRGRGVRKRQRSEKRQSRGRD
jgi:hypothetical protein